MKVNSIDIFCEIIDNFGDRSCLQNIKRVEKNLSKC